MLRTQRVPRGGTPGAREQPPSGSLGVMVAIPVKSRYTVVREACDEPTTEGSVARPDGRRAVQARGVGACDECAGRAGDAGTGAAGGGRWPLVYRGRQAGGS